MSLESDIVDRVLADASLTGLISTRVYVEWAPQNTDMPYVTFQVVSTVEDHHTQGSSGLAHSRIQFDVWAETIASRDSVVDALRSEFQSVRGELTVGGTFAYGSGWSGPSNSIVPPDDAGETAYRRAICELMLSYGKTATTL